MKALVINGKSIEPGSKEALILHVGRLPSGTKIFIKTIVFTSRQPGPTMLVLAGLHGDEINGVEIIRASIISGLFDQLVLGNVIVIPLLNIYGFLNFSREVPDGKDVNRSFPGNMRGSLASRVARILSKKVMPVVDFGVDFHTGGDNRYNFPQIRYTRRDEFAHTLACQFGAPFTIEKGLIRKSLRKTAKDLGKPIIVYEGGESLRLDGFAIDCALKGLRRLMYKQGLINESEQPASSVLIRKTTWVRSNHAGLFIWTKRSGNKITKGESLGSIYDPYGEGRIPVYSNRDGYIIGHNNTPVVNQGDALFHIGYDEKILD